MEKRTPTTLLTMEQALAADPEIGRRKLMQQTGRTAWACMRFLQGIPAGSGKMRRHDKQITVTDKVKAAPAGAISLHGGVRVLNTKPASDNVKKQLYSLRKGQGYPVEQLADQWGVSVETLRRHAKRLDCLKYVETGPGDWVHCVLHPDTAEDYRKGN